MERISKHMITEVKNMDRMYLITTAYSYMQKYGRIKGPWNKQGTEKQRHQADRS